ncbi:hypothetical protein C7E16_15675 [Acinetobacter radioresistens]|uniref:hypothetical protein n=1 Tax=Acinetobacter radioresistens TaxID=40216 RepID=UPI000D0BA678|nr:hypothetical protein [Acinetobacter radioresistens]PSD34284.1 hypothetical protein C7E16_15675 [Acinetobacter radioresistens]PSD34752.1 hypothetical protein C7E21_15145 [Acinetobacter radioresistens]
MNKTFGIFIFYLLLMLGGSILITGLVVLQIFVLMLGTFIVGCAFILKTRFNLDIRFWKDG